MVSPIGNRNSIYNITSGIEGNAALNRGMMEVFGMEIPWIIMSNNRDERIERSLRSVLLILFSLAIPTATMPIFNKFFLKRAGIIDGKSPKEVNILIVSKKCLANDADTMVKGFRYTAKELEKEPKFKNIGKNFEGVLNRFPDKEVLRKKLIKAHGSIFRTNFILSCLLVASMPWLSNYLTAERTGRKGYVAEFKMANNKYTDNMTQGYEKNKNLKVALSCAFALLPGVIIPGLATKAMLKPANKLGSVMKLLKKKADLFNYTNNIYLSKASLFAMMVLSDFPTFLLSSRDRHELKYKTTLWGFVFSMMFAGDPLLNNVFGRISDRKFGTSLMNKKGFEKAGFWKKFLMPVKSLEKLKKMTNLPNWAKTRKAAVIIYWANLALTTAFIGFGVPNIANKQLRKDVTKGQKSQINSKPPVYS
jgi:hypothetical protein